MAWRACDADHTAAVIQCPPGAVHDHVKAAPLQSRQSLVAAAISLEVLHPCWNRMVSAGEQGQIMALGLETRHKRFANKPSPTHDQDLHGSPLQKRCH